MTTHVRIRVPYRRLWQELPPALPAGAWFVGVAGELRVQDDGTIEVRPTPWPWTRPSIAAVPATTRRKP
jgi:hypothetical protein